ncbi:cytosine permease [Saccharopolyspora sp. K220]|uniref:purine-cytosine permease family protein n=1 Tax=Saccharopolyspora soli TaxID=2926618 RepID=UPI001F5A3C80|nr:cytosine permease [Saccharopolyspora soli]MCI2421564.1 cytosine permease [Saccharopolyspora soli]
MAKETILPLARRDRHAGFLSIFWLWAGGNVLLTNFISGSSYALGLGFWPMLMISVTGYLLALAFCAWDSQRSARYGIDEMVSLRPTFGYRGSIYGVIVLVGVNFGWVGILASMAGSAMKLVVENVGGGLTFAGDYTLYSVGIGIVLPLIIVMFSQKAAFQLSKITVPILLAFIVYILVRLFTGGYLHGMATKPGDGSESWMGAFEIIFAFSISWFPYLGSWNRFARSERIGLWGTYLGLGVTGILFAVIGGMATLATGEVDPAQWSNKLDLGLVALGIIVLGTVTSVTHLLGSGSMGILSIGPKWNYRWVCVIVTVPSILFVYATSLQAMFNLLLVFVGLLAGPYWAIALADYFFLRKQNIDAAACYDPRGKYRFVGGVNLLAVGCMVVGMVVWIFLGGWLSGIPALTFPAGMALFEYISATLPCMIVSGALYYVAAKIFFARRTAGGYQPAPAKAQGEPAESAPTSSGSRLPSAGEVS